MTEDALCPRFLEPSLTSPIPPRLPSIESTIKDMYVIQDRVHHLQEVLDPETLPIEMEKLYCRAHGQDKLCDGFVCYEGMDCHSGCCATFGLLKQDYCQPLVGGMCPVAGFSYGPLGNTHYSDNLDRRSEPLSDSIEDIPMPPEFNEHGSGSLPAEEQKKENNFWKGILVGISIWVGVIISLLTAYFLCKKNSAVSAESQS